MKAAEPKRSGPLSLLQQAGFAALPEGWSVLDVGNLLSEDRGISVGVMYPGDHTPGGVPLLKVGDLSGSRINPNPDYFISHETHIEYRRTELRGGELLLTLVGAIGQCAIVPSSMSGWNAARAIAVIRLKNEKDAGYVRYCLLSQPLQHLMQAWATTTVQATLNLKEIKQLPLPWPSEVERQRIVQIAGCLESKIELNRRMNETLEGMARTLFRSWFVDFDPVRAKADGQKPQGIDTATAKLFPDSFEPSALGPIPKGWRVGLLSELLSISRDGSNPLDYPNETFDHYSIPAFDEGRRPQQEAGSAIKSNKYLVPASAVLLSKLNPRIPRVWFPSVAGSRRSVCSTEFLVCLAHALLNPSGG